MREALMRKVYLTKLYFWTGKFNFLYSPEARTRCQSRRGEWR